MRPSASRWPAPGSGCCARAALPAAGLYPLATLAIALLGFAAASLAGASGIIAIYLAGLLLGNSPPAAPARDAGLRRGARAGWPRSGCSSCSACWRAPAGCPTRCVPALVAGFALTLVARPLSVFALRAPVRVSAGASRRSCPGPGLRGAVPIVLTTDPVAAGIAGSLRIFDIVFLLVVVYTLIQGPTLPRAARLGRGRGRPHARDVQIESAPLDEAAGRPAPGHGPAGSRLAGVWVADLRLPVGAALALVVRDGTLFAAGAGLRFCRSATS